MAEQIGRPTALFARPEAAELSVERESVEGACAKCGGERLERYPVLRVTGWKRVTRCPDCLTVAAEEDAPTPLGFTYTPYGSYLRQRLDAAEQG